MLNDAPRLLIRFAFVAAFACFAASAAAQDEPGITLTISGAIERGKVEFRLAELEKIGTTIVETTTPWTEGKQVFEGVLVRELLQSVGARRPSVTVIARNDYKMTISTAEFAKYRVLLAWRMNGELLRVRDKGPLWLVYPQDDHSELRNKETQAKWVWQIKEIRID